MQPGEAGSRVQGPAFEVDELMAFDHAAAMQQCFRLAQQ